MHQLDFTKPEQTINNNNFQQNQQTGNSEICLFFVNLLQKKNIPPSSFLYIYLQTNLYYYSFIISINVMEWNPFRFIFIEHLTSSMSPVTLETPSPTHFMHFFINYYVLSFMLFFALQGMKRVCSLYLRWVSQRVCCTAFFGH